MYIRDFVNLPLRRIRSLQTHVRSAMRRFSENTQHYPTKNNCIVYDNDMVQYLTTGTA
jgi:hypothetical protein